MTTTATSFEGVWLIRFDRVSDERGESVKTFSERDYDRLGLPSRWTQTLVVRNHHRGTLRGMHWQAEPDPETKLVCCSRGRVFDVLVDLRKRSATLGSWAGFELSADEPAALLVPPGFAHGYLTIEDHSELLYQIAGDYRPESQRALRWSDPDVAIEWPFAPALMSERDASAPLLCDHLARTA